MIQTLNMEINMKLSTETLAHAVKGRYDAVKTKQHDYQQSTRNTMRFAVILEHRKFKLASIN